MAFFLMRCIHNDGQDEKRNKARATHRDWVKSGGDGLASVLVGSALLNKNGQSAGHFGILEAESLQDAERFAVEDPFNMSGVVATIEITPLPDTFQADRIPNRMTE